MDASAFLLVLAALTGATSDQVYKIHHHVSQAMNWTLARDFCRDKYVDLSILDTQLEYNRFVSQMPGGITKSWIGLWKKQGETKFTRWCDGTAVNFTQWDSTKVIDASENCITSDNNQWNQEYCIHTLPFFCYSEVILVEDMKTWDEAHEFCLNNYTDLISLTPRINENVFKNIQLPSITETSFWIGLHVLDGSWFWVNMNPGLQLATPSCPNQPFLCGSRNSRTSVWESRDCMRKLCFACIHQGR